MSFTEESKAVLTPLLQTQRIGLITDFDGTLSEIVPVPEDAQPTPRNRDLLNQLVERLSLLAFVSGRAVGDLRQRMPVEGAIYAGNHGMERWSGGLTTTPPQVAAYRPNIEHALTDIRALAIDGLNIEDKLATISVHYRNVASDAVASVAEGLARIAAAHQLKMTSGHLVHELRPPVTIDKGTTFRDMVKEYNLDGAIFIGDDTTDADAMRGARTMRDRDECYSVAVGVESASTPDAVRDSADFLVAGVSGVEDLLDWLLTSLSASAS